MTAEDDSWTRRVPRPGSAVRSAVLRFTLSSLVALLVLTAGTILIAERIARHQALEYASEQGAGVADRLAAPLVDRSVRRDPVGSSGDLDLVMGNRIADGSLRHVKLWDVDGRIIWADEQDLVGQRFDLDDDVAVLFGTTKVTAELSDLSKDENYSERDEGELLEVYVGTFDADGAPLVFEAYLPVDRMEDDADTIVLAFVPLVTGALVLFLAIVLPLAVSLSRRVERAQLAESRMMRHALLASDLERRRIAADLHDGVIQDLAGLAYVLPTVTREMRDSDQGEARSVLERATDILQHDTAMLRSLIADLYPPDLEGEGLRDAVEHLVRSGVADSGLVADVVVQEGLSTSDEGGRLVYRIVREALRNVVKHAGASRVLVEVTEHDGQVSVRVQDDGQGPGQAVVGAAPPTDTTEGGWDSAEGHLGLTLLRDTLHDLGGALELRPVPTGGAALVARFPAKPAPA
ncbi:sensor histidine kinase [Nocardioides sp. P5_C9_2]